MLQRFLDWKLIVYSIYILYYLQPLSAMDKAKIPKQLNSHSQKCDPTRRKSCRTLSFVSK